MFLIVRRTNLAPTIAFASPLTNPPTIQVSNPAAFLVLNDTVEVQSADNIGFTGATTYSNQADAAEVGAGRLGFPFPFFDATTYFRVRINGGDWSSALTYTPTWTALQFFQNTGEGAFAGTKGLWAHGKLSTYMKQTRVTADSGSTAIAAYGDPVGFLQDLSGNGNHLSQATAGLRPTYNAGDVGLNFDGVDDFLERATLAAQITGNTLWCAIAISSGGGGSTNGRIASVKAAGDTSDILSTTAASLISFVGGGTTVQGGRNGSSKSTTTGSLVSGTTSVIESKWDGTNHTMTLDGTAATPVGSTGSFTVDMFRLMAQAASSPGTYGKGIIKDVVLLNRIPTANEITSYRAFASGL